MEISYKISQKLQSGIQMKWVSKRKASSLNFYNSYFL